MPKSKNKICLIAIFIATVAAFALSWDFSYINIDDPQYFVLPKQVTSGLSTTGLHWSLTDISNAIWMPITWLVYQFDYTLRDFLICFFPDLDGFQLAYSIAHIQSILIHSINALLLFCFFRKLVPETRLPIVLLSVLIWAIHPLRVESVVWIASMKDVLSMFFLLLALICWLDYRKKSSEFFFILSNCALVLACCCKPTVVIYPGLIMLIDFLVFGRENALPIGNKHYRDYLPAILIVVPTALIAQIAQISGGATSFQANIPLWYRLLNAITSIGVYVRNFICPTSLAPQCQIQWPNMPHFFLPGIFIGVIVIIIALGMLVFVYRKLKKETLSGRYITTGVLWMAGSLLPVLGISAFGGHSFADRFTYIPFVGISICLLTIKRKVTLMLIGAVVCIFGFMTIKQVRYWRNDGSLMLRLLEVDGDKNVTAHMNYAKYLYEHEHTSTNLTVAEKHFSRAYELNPSLCQNSAIIYMMLLGEVGKNELMQKINSDFSFWLTGKGITRCLDLDLSDGLCSLYCGDSESDIHEARNTALKFIRLGDVDVFQLYYYIYLVGQRCNEKRTMQYAIDRIRRLSNYKTGYDNSIRFRFLLKD